MPLPNTFHVDLACDTQHSIYSKQSHNLCQNQSALQVELSSFQSIVQTQSKSPLKSFPWKTGAMHFRFLPVRPSITRCMKANSFALSQHIGLFCLLLAQTQQTKQVVPGDLVCAAEVQATWLIQSALLLLAMDNAESGKIVYLTDDCTSLACTCSQI